MEALPEFSIQQMDMTQTNDSNGLLRSVAIEASTLDFAPGRWPQGVMLINEDRKPHLQRAYFYLDNFDYNGDEVAGAVYSSLKHDYKLLIIND